MADSCKQQLENWQAVWQQHSKWLRTVLLARLRDSGEADDVLQEVAITAWRNRDQLNDEAKLEPWLYRIAVRQVLMHWRKRKRHDRLLPLGDQDSIQPDQHTNDPAEFIASKEAHQQVRDALDNLAAQDREILLLKHVEGWSYLQISERLNVSYDKVIYRLSRARQRMRKQLSNYVCNEII